jgi:signal transduction histidine kinase
MVFSYLTANAIEAMPTGGALLVSASGCSISDTDGLPLLPGEYVHVTFRDTGKGIQAENLVRIFDPYFTTKEMGSQKGMGLGLSICHAIIRKHNGVITAESQPGQGATFHIYLPVSGNGTNTNGSA